MPDPKFTGVFNQIWDAYKAGEKLIILQGGQGSSKTHSVLQLLALIAKTHHNKRITIASYALPHLKSGVMIDFDKILMEFNINPGLVKNKSDSVYRFPSGSTVEFFGIEGNIAKAHGPRRDVLFINECNRKITYEVFDQLNTRTQESTFLDFNPDQSFWLHEKVIPNFEHVVIKSNFTDNPYLPEKERQNILMKRDKPGFENWWRVYGLGELGKLEGAILPNWRYVREGEKWGEGLPYGFGQDFGYNDPDALVKEAVDHKRRQIWLDEIIYGEGNSLDQLVKLMMPHVNRNDLVIADSADARMIRNLTQYFRVQPVDKSKFTVAEALKIMQGYEIIISERSVNLAKELNNYVWSDSKAGIPVDAFNHLIDAARYYFMWSVGSSQPVTRAVG